MSFDIVQFVGSQVSLFNAALSDQSITWQREMQFAIQAFQKNKYLAGVATANPVSAQNAIINIAAIGITLNPAAKLAYLVPRDGMVCLDVSYMGLLHLAQSTGAIKWGQCKLVHQGDTYESNGLDAAPTHKYNAFGDRGPVVGGYCTVKTADGDYLTEEMSIAEINGIMERSSGYQSYLTKKTKCPWVTDWNEMARKTIVKRASKYWPRVDRLDAAINHLNTDGGEGIAESPEPEQIVNVDEAIIAAVAKQGREMPQFFEWSSKLLKRQIASLDDITEPEKQGIARKLEASK